MAAGRVRFYFRGVKIKPILALPFGELVATACDVCQTPIKIYHSHE